MTVLRIYNLDGCGGCQLSVLSIRPNIVSLFDIVEYVSVCNHDKKADIGMAIGRFKKDILSSMLQECEKLIICGECANDSFDKTADKSKDEGERIYRSKGCSLNGSELIYIIQCIIKVIKPKQKNYPVCMECRLNENVCLLTKRQKCKGPITQAGCNARCPGQGIVCRGCRGTLDNAKEELLGKVWEKRN